jgi:hypothetical protein
MIRKLSLVVLAAAALSGCVTSGYGYRGGSGDYYYGRASPSHYGYGAPYGGVGYGYPGGWYGSIGYGSTYYRGPYRHGYGPYYGPGYGVHYGPYYPPYRRHTVVRPPHPQRPGPPHVERPGRPDHPGRTGIPWRDLDDLRGPKPGVPPMSTPSRPDTASTPMHGRPGGASPFFGPQPRADDRSWPMPRAERPEGRRAGTGSGHRIREETP